MKHKRNPLRTIWNIMRHTHTDKILYTYLFFVFLDAALIWVFEPTLKTYREALWYCYAVISTAGFGDVVVTTFIPKLLSVLLTAYSLLVIAILTGVIANYYMQVLQARDKETLVHFMDRVEQLPELSKEELAELAEKVKTFRDKGIIEKE